MRAPEVYEGSACFHRSQTWACAAMLLCWMRPGVLGAAGSPNKLFHEAWSIAKIRRLFPDWTPLPRDDPILKAEFAYSEELVSELPPDIRKTSLEDEMEAASVLPEMRRLLRRLFVVDPEKRLSAAEVLESKEFLALAEKARAGLE